MSGVCSVLASNLVKADVLASGIEHESRFVEAGSVVLSARTYRGSVTVLFQRPTGGTELFALDDSAVIAIRVKPASSGYYCQEHLRNLRVRRSAL